MPALPRPDVPSGPQRDLVDALHDLHHRAGWPSLRTLAREAGCSPTTVSAAFSTDRLPSWGVLELLVEAMDGSVPEFRDLWLAAGSQPHADGATARRLAGRRQELATVRRQLDGGSGLLVLAGEAGIGKSRLIGTARALTAETPTVLLGSCLPLSADVPLLPVSDLLRGAFRHDDSGWLTAALAICPPYVADAVGALVPELDAVEVLDPGGSGDFARQRLLTAVGTILDALASVRPLALVVEDLHWADATTLDLLELLLNRGIAVPLVGTWRTDDPATPASTLEWFVRVRRLPTVHTLDLAPLSREETADQLALLAGEPVSAARVDSIYRRTQGQPLFTEQLAAHAEEGHPLPRLLGDLLDERLQGLEPGAWTVARTLGVADRPLSPEVVPRASGLRGEHLTAALRRLDERRLLARDAGDDVRLRHPLLALAIRRRLVPGEAAGVHERLAEALAGTPNATAAEIATHWQLARRPEQEIRWRITAAQAARSRFALDHESAQWSRVLELWPDPEVTFGDPAWRLCDVYRAAFDALANTNIAEAAPLMEEALLLVPGLPPADQADLLRRAGSARSVLGDPADAVRFADRAIAACAPAGPSRGLVEALRLRAGALRSLGRFDEGRVDVARGVDVATTLDDAVLRRQMLAVQAWHELLAGDRVRALAHVEAAAAITPPVPDPEGDVRLGVYHTDLLLIAGADAERILDAARAGLSAGDTWELDTNGLAVLRANVAEALVRAGRIREAAAIVDPATGGPVSVDRSIIHARRAHLDALRGRWDAAAERFAALAALPSTSASNRVGLAELRADAHLWQGDAAGVWRHLLDTLEPVLVTDVAGLAAIPLVLLARAAGDLAARGHSPPATHLHRDLMTLHARCAVDPFGADAVAGEHVAARATWVAELARVVGRPSLDAWAAAATAWDRLGRPHDAAYCRWRGAQVALASGQGSVAARLLRRAARDAAEHVPLRDAVQSTAAYAQPRESRR